jgi:hypothetical protein
MTGWIRTAKRRYAVSLPIIELGFFAVMITAMSMVA